MATEELMTREVPHRDNDQIDAYKFTSLDTESHTESIDLHERPSTHEPRRLSRLHFTIIISAILVSNFATALDASLSASTHVAVASAFDRTNISTWPINVFFITSMSAQPIYARVSDHVGRKLPYLVASSIFLFGSILSANAFSWASLVAARAVCGLGVAGVMAMGSITLTDTVGIGRRGYYQSLNYAMYGTGSAIGSGIGGLIVEKFGWTYMYQAQIPGAICALLLVASMTTMTSSPSGDSEVLKKPKTHDGLHNYDWLGSLSLILSLVALFLTLNTGAFPWRNEYGIIPLIATAIFTAVFLRIEQKAEKPILPLDLLFEYPTRNVLVAGFLFSAINYTVMYTTTTFFQTVRLESMKAAGTRLVLPSVVFTVMSVISGSLIAKWKSPSYTLRISQGILLIGTSGLVVATGILSQYRVPSFIYNMVLIFPAAAVGMMAPSSVLTLLTIVDHEDHAVANGSLNMVRAMGGFIATALSTAILQNVLNVSIGARNYDATTLKTIKAVRQDVELLLTLHEPLRSEIVEHYRRACTTVFNTCAVGALIIVASLATIKVRTFEGEGNSEKDEDFDTADTPWKELEPRK